MNISRGDQYSLFYALFEKSFDAMLLTTPDGRCFLANQAAQDLLGYSNDEFASLKRSDFLDENDPHVIAMLRQRAASGAVQGRVNLRKKNGNWLDTQLSSFLFNDRQGQRWAGTIIRDMTEQLRLQRELEDAKHFYMNVFEALFEGVVLYNAAGEVYACNGSATRMLGLSFDELKGRTPFDPRWKTVGKDGLPFPPHRFATSIALATGKPVKGVEIGHIKPNGELSWLRVNANPLFRDADPMPYMVVTAFEEMTEKTTLELELRKQALTDPLTGAGNRRAFMDRIQQLFALSRRARIPASLLMLDVNGFKAINDDYGHAVGDDVLITLCECISSTLRSSDYVARFGGDEFCILLPDTGPDSALEMIHRLQQAIGQSASVVVGLEPVKASVSIGVATLGAQDDNVRSWIKRADDALYKVKREKNQC